jgi:hypothetical protein
MKVKNYADSDLDNVFPPVQSLFFELEDFDHYVP